MVDETVKALLRRHTDSRFSSRYMVGRGIDFSEPNNTPRNFQALLPLVKEFRFWRDHDGDPSLVESVADESYDFVHSNNFLEHMPDPELAILHWIRICKTNGHLVIVVPDEDRYEQGIFPSTYNPDHKWSFTINKSNSWSKNSINVLDLAKKFEIYTEIIKIEVLDVGYKYGDQRVDQTFDGLAESGIEIVLRKSRAISKDFVPGAVTRPPQRILLRRWWAMGDCIMVTPCLSRLRAECGNDVQIDIVTKRPDVFRGATNIGIINPEEIRYYDYNRVINLDLAYESRPGLHPVDAYMVAIFGNADWQNKQTSLLQENPGNQIPLDWSRAVAIHAGDTIRSRMMPRAFWDALIRLLINQRLTPVIVGGGKDQTWPDTNGVIDLTNKHNINETAWVIGRCACFVSCDTGVMHIAGTTSTPIVTIYTTVRPEYRMPWRFGEFGWKTTALVPALDCIGCNSGGECRRGDFACVEGAEAIKPETAFRAVMKYVSSCDVALV